MRALAAKAVTYLAAASSMLAVAGLIWLQPPLFSNAIHGTIANENQVRVVRHDGRGVISSVYVSEGDVVMQGDLIAVIAPQAKQETSGIQPAFPLIKAALRVGDDADETAINEGDRQLRAVIPFDDPEDARKHNLMRQLIEMDRHLARGELRAPVDGIVNSLMVTKGRAIGPLDPLAEIIPADTPLIIDARIDPFDAKELRIGLQANLKISNETAEPTQFVGTVVRIENPLDDQAMVRLEIDKSAMQSLPRTIKGRDIELRPAD